MTALRLLIAAPPWRRSRLSPTALPAPGASRRRYRLAHCAPSIMSNATRSMSLQPDADDTAPSWLTLLFAAACGLVVANLYYAQPLIAPISAALSLSPQLPA